MNVAEMVKNVKAECHPVTNIDGIIRRWLDRGQKVVASKHRFSWLRQYKWTLATVASQEFYALSPLVDTSKLIIIYNPTDQTFISGMTEMEFRRYEPGPSTGSPYLYRLVGFSPVLTQPTTASVLDLVSTSASDTAVIVTVQGLDSAGILFTEEVTTNGLTVVSTSTSVSKVLSLSKATTSIGTISVSAGATVLVKIAPRDRSVQHPIIALFNIPDAVDSLCYDFTMKLPTLSDDHDISLIPEQYHDVPELYAKWQCFKHLNNPTMTQAVAMEFAARVNDMIADDYQPTGVFAMNSFRPNQLPLAQLPGMYPRDDT